MMILITLLAILLSSCQQAPKKPKGEIFIVNAHPTKEPLPYALVFNLETDFDDNLKLKDGAQGVHKTVDINALHKHWCMPSPSKEDLQRYALEWKQRYIQLQKQLDECN
jgi:hypothetical protein